MFTKWGFFLLIFWTKKPNFANSGYDKLKLDMSEKSWAQLKRMNRLLILLSSIFLISCCNEPNLLKNGLTKKADKITVHYIKVESDSLNNKVQDTISVREKKYNINDQIINLFQQTLFDNETLEIEYIYNDLNKIKTEIVKISTDSLPFKVNYNYKDLLLYQSEAIVENSNERFEQVETYYYRKDGTKEKTISTQIFVDFESTDTIRNSVSKSYFDKNDFIKRIETIHHDKPNLNGITEFRYDCGTLIKTLEYNYKDSLISTIEYKYEVDKFKNWVRKESIKNDKLNYIQTREIEYK